MPVKYTGAVRPPARRSTSWRSKKGCSPSGARTTSSPRASGGARARRSGCSTKGPPTANGRPGIHHVWAAAFKDLYPRFQTMRGRYVARKGGLGLPRPAGRGRGREGARHHQQARDRGVRHRPRSTSGAASRCSATWRTGRRSPPASGCGSTPRTPTGRSTTTTSRASGGSSARCGTRATSTRATRSSPTAGAAAPRSRATSSASPARTSDVTEPSVYVRFPVVDRDFDLLVWTTTPWTLDVERRAPPSGPTIEYVRVRTGSGRDLVLAAARVGDVLGDDAEVVGPVPVDDLVGLHYERPFDLISTLDDRRRGRGSSPTSSSPSTTAPASCTSPPRSARSTARSPNAEGLPMLNPVGPDATFVDTPHRGQVREGRRSRAHRGAGDATDARARSSSTRTRTRTAGGAARRSSTGPSPRGSRAPSAHKDELLRENEAIGWHPEHIKHGRFGDWLENNVDWALSRDRFWGTPLPVWRCDDCGTDTCVGSVAELAELAGSDLADLDLHRPDVDDVAIDCPKCEGGRSRRVEPVLDVWFDSGAMPAAQFHYPFEGQDLFERRFPADFICEAIDQTRGLVLLVARGEHARVRRSRRTATSSAWRCSSTRTARRCRSRKGNVIDPWTVLETPRRRRAALELLLAPARRGRRGGSRSKASTSPRSGSS